LSSTVISPPQDGQYITPSKWITSLASRVLVMYHYAIEIGISACQERPYEEKVFPTIKLLIDRN
jgi:hypothetical protein